MASRLAGRMSAVTTWNLKLMTVVATVLIALMIFASTLVTPVKMLLLAVVGLFSTVELIRQVRQRTLDTRFALVLLTPVAMGGVFTLHGMMNDYVGAVPMGRVYVVYPLLIAMFALCLRSATSMRVLLGGVVVASIATYLYAAVFLASAGGLLPEWLQTVPIQAKQIYVPGIDGGFPTSSFVFLGGWMFSIPFLTTWLLSDKPTRPQQVFLVIVLGLALALAMLTGRKALILVLALFPVVLLVMNRWWRGTWFGGLRWYQAVIRLGSMAVVSAIACSAFVTFAPNACCVAPMAEEETEWSSRTLGRGVQDLSKDVSEAFDPAASPDAAVRTGQAKALVAAWRTSPLMGKGFGAHAPGHVRDPAMPWAYELTYLSLLLQVGLVGMLFYAGLILMLLRELAAVCRRNSEWGVAAVGAAGGLLCFLLGNATNPYLAKFDSMWVLALPVFLIAVTRARPRVSARPPAVEAQQRPAARS